MIWCIQNELIERKRNRPWMITFDFFLIKFMECVVFLFSFVYGDKIKSEAVILYMHEERELMQTQLFTSLGLDFTSVCAWDPLPLPPWLARESRSCILLDACMSSNTSSSRDLPLPRPHEFWRRCATSSSRDPLPPPPHEIWHFGLLMRFVTSLSLAHARVSPPTPP